MRESHRIIKNKGSISVANSKEWRVDATTGGAKDKAGTGGKEVEKKVEVHKDRCCGIWDCDDCEVRNRKKVKVSNSTPLKPGLCICSQIPRNSKVLRFLIQL